MKYITKPMAILILSLIVGVLVSCSKKEENTTPPTIELIAEQGFITDHSLVGPAQEMKFKINSQSNGTHVLTNFIVTSNGVRAVDEGINTDSFVRDIVLNKNSEPQEIIEFVVRDIDGKEAKCSVTITLDESAGDTEPIWYSNVVLKAQGVEDGQGFISLANGSLFTLEGARANQGIINMVYYYDTVESDANTISSPGANIDNSIIAGLSDWITRNTSRFIAKEMTQEEFEEINSVLFLVDAYPTTGNRKAKNLKVGDVFAFKDEARNKFGMFRVYGVEGETQGQITISVVIQP
ncbi:MAG: hypothetical protein RBT74_07375 [Tenuifilaceae bacterium]|jgi:hypothetical protein|nr:hypothetical protein [Tenuifilaceae bacterium]